MTFKAPAIRLRTLLILYCTLVTLLLTAAVVLLHSRLFERYALNNLMAQGKTITLNTAFLVAGELVTENYAFLQEFAADFAARTDIESIWISDSQGVILAAVDPGLLGSKIMIPPPGDRLWEDELFCVRHDPGAGTLTVSTPVTIGRQQLGLVRVQLSTREMLAHLRQIQRQGVTVGLIFWLLAVTAGYFLARRLTGPVHHFMAATEAIRQGNFQVEIPRNPLVHELKHFGQALRLMAYTIAQREDEVVRIRKLLHNIIESMPSVLVTINEAGVITQWNSAAARFTGISAQEAIGRRLEDTAPFLSRYVAQVEETSRLRDPVVLHRERLQEDDDHLYNLTFFPLMANGIDGVVIRMDDISEMEKKEQQLRQAQKMESIGILAGGLAHDFNNVLTGIMGNLSLVRYKIKNNEVTRTEELRGYLEQMDIAGRRAMEMVRQLLTLARRHKPQQVSVDLLLTIDHVRKLCEVTFDRAVRIVVRTPPEVEQALVLGDPTEMEQALLNLCVNALHAMTFMRKDGTWGGTMTLALDQVAADEKFRQSHPEAREDAYWRLSVNDSGVGMDRETKAKIFQPFFTTKEQGKGTGLGLSTVYSIAGQHGGFVSLYSEPGLGSTFSLYLPQADRLLPRIAVEEKTSIERGAGLILVVDDDPLVLRLACESLKNLGYEALEATNGREGVDIYRRRQDEIRAVLLDMVMPVLSGRDAFLELQKINPEVKVIMASGFRQDERVDEVLMRGAQCFLQKPFDLDTLAQALKKVLRQAGPLADEN